jgi:hypothetical protein
MASPLENCDHVHFSTMGHLSSPRKQNLSEARVKFLTLPIVGTRSDLSCELAMNAVRQAVPSRQMQSHRLQQFLDAVPANLHANTNQKK